MKYTWFEVAPGLASLEHYLSLPGDESCLELQLLLHVGSWPGPEASEKVGWSYLLATLAPKAEART